MRAIIESFDGRWDQLLERVPHDIHHTSGYQRYADATELGHGQLLVIGDSARGLAWPYMLRRVNEVEGLEGADARDIGSMHGYTGPLVWGVSPGDPWLGAAWKEALGAWRSQGAVSTFVRFHPLLGNHALATGFADALGEHPVTRLGTTVSIDCTLDDDAALGAYARVTRQEIAQARRAGLTTEHDEEWREMDTFVRLYAETMARNDAASIYDMSPEHMGRLRRELAGRLHLLVTRADETVVVAGLFSECDGIVQALLVGVDQGYRRHSPLKVLLDDARRWARRRANRVLYLGGGRGGRHDSLLDFKGRFSKRRHDLHIGRWIVDPAGYRDLVAAHRRHVRSTGGDVASDDWFPAYRGPLRSRPEPIAIPVSKARGPGFPPRLAAIPIRVLGDVHERGPAGTKGVAASSGSADA